MADTEMENAVTETQNSNGDIKLETADDSEHGKSVTEENVII